MSRIAYWTIMVANGPTAFRARTADALVPTLKQLQRRHPDAVLKWFEAGRIWDSPEQARFGRQARREVRRGRGRDWRPGGTHRDPRAKYKLPRGIKRRVLARRHGWKRKDQGDDEG